MAGEVRRPGTVVIKLLYKLENMSADRRGTEIIRNDVYDNQLGRLRVAHRDDGVKQVNENESRSRGWMDAALLRATNATFGFNTARRNAAASTVLPMLPKTVSAFSRKDHGPGAHVSSRLCLVHVIIY